MNFLEYVSLLAERKSAAGKTKTRDNYLSAVRMFSHFLRKCGGGACGYDDGAEGGGALPALPLDEVDSALMLRYQDYLTSERKMRRNSSSAYMRPLRAAYNMAVESGLCADRRPFSKVYTGVDRTRKRGVGEDDMAKLFSLSLPADSPLALSRDLFLFCFLARGMAFIDLAKLSKANIVGEHLVYVRSKTGQGLSVKISDTMRRIMRKYMSERSQRIFPVLRDGVFTQKAYDSALHLYNRHLRQLAALALTSSLSSYSARHSWASQAYRKHVPLSVISSCMGHTTEATTRIYLQSLDCEETDRLCRTVTKKYERIWDTQNTYSHKWLKNSEI